MQVHARREEVTICEEREAGVALVQAVKAALVDEDCDGILLGD